jgi:hypothetical protein
MGGVMADQRGFFDLDERYAALSKAPSQSHSRNTRAPMSDKIL